MTPSWRAAATTAFVVHVLGSPLATTPVTAQAFPYPTFDDVSVRGFAQEVLYGTGSGRTPLFHDSKDSYHVQPDALLKQLPVEAVTHGLRLSAAIVVGPVGELWAYDVLAFIEEPSCMRVNRVVMPHARITYKATACLPKTEVTEWLIGFRTQVTATPGTSSADSSCALLADYAGAKPTLARAAFGCDHATTAVLGEWVREMSMQLVTTYHTYPPVPFPRERGIR